MEDPVKEIRDVIRGVTEPNEAKTLAENVEKYFTRDSILLHPLVNIPRSENSRELVKGLYKILRMGTIGQKIVFNSVMFNEDKTQAAIDLTEHLHFRYSFFSSSEFSGRLLVILDLVQCEDGKYRITRQQDNIISDLSMSGLSSLVPGLTTLHDFVKYNSGYLAGMVGKFLLDRKWFGA